MALLRLELILMIKGGFLLRHHGLWQSVKIFNGVNFLNCN